MNAVLFSATERLTSIDSDSVVIVKVAQSCLTLCDPVDYTVHGILQAQIRVGSLSLLQGIFLTQESNWGLLHCRQFLSQLSYCGSPEWLCALLELNQSLVYNSCLSEISNNPSFDSQKDR